MDLTQDVLDKAALVLVVGYDGLLEWSSDYAAPEVAAHLRKVADAIEVEAR